MIDLSQDMLLAFSLKGLVSFFLELDAIYQDDGLLLCVQCIWIMHAMKQFLKNMYWSRGMGCTHCLWDWWDLYSWCSSWSIISLWMLVKHGELENISGSTFWERSPKYSSYWNLGNNIDDWEDKWVRSALDEIIHNQLVLRNWVQCSNGIKNKESKQHVCGLL